MSATDTRPLALAYVRVSTADQADNGASLDAQAAALVEAAERQGYRVEVVREEGRSGKSLSGRPALADALRRLRKGGDAVALYAQRVDRLTRSVPDFAFLLDDAKSQGWRLAFVEGGEDTASPNGEFLTTVLAAAAQYERRLIGARTRDALAQRRREGVRLGRPSVLAAEIVERIVRERQAGASLRTIAEGLNADNVPTAHDNGKAWYASTVSKVLRGQDAQALAA